MSASTALRSVPVPARAIPIVAPRVRRPAQVRAHPVTLPAICDAAVTAAVARAAFRFRLTADQAADLRSDLWVKLAAGHGRMLRRFRGEATLTTFLTTVAINVLRDQRDHLWGKWRPSITARRFGPDGIALERLLRRDGLSLDEAEHWFRAADPEADLSWMAPLAARLSRRPRRRVVPLASLRCESLPAPLSADPVRTAELAVARRDTLAALRRALALLPAADASLLLERFGRGRSLTDLAAASGTAAKPLYRRCEHLLRALRAQLETAGVRAEVVEEWIGMPIGSSR